MNRTNQPINQSSIHQSIDPSNRANQRREAKSKALRSQTRPLFSDDAPCLLLVLLPSASAAIAISPTLIHVVTSLTHSHSHEEREVATCGLTSIVMIFLMTGFTSLISSAGVALVVESCEFELEAIVTVVFCYRLTMSEYQARREEGK
jgi:hypothetical protein